MTTETKGPSEDEVLVVLTGKFQFTYEIAKTLNCDPEAAFAVLKRLRDNGTIRCSSVGHHPMWRIPTCKATVETKGPSEEEVMKVLEKDGSWLSVGEIAWELKRSGSAAPVREVLDRLCKENKIEINLRGQCCIWRITKQAAGV